MENNKSGKKPMSFAGALLLCIMVSTAVSAAMVGYYHNNYAVKVMVADIEGYTQQQRKRFVAGEIGMKEVEERFDALKTNLDSMPPNYIVLSATAVLTGGEEVGLAD